jgi:hypothetical protein
MHNGKIGLLHDDKVEIFFVKALPLPFFGVTIMCIACNQSIWMFGLLQLFRLARYFRQGRIFDEANARCLRRLSGVMAALCVANAANPVIISFAFYMGGVTSWLSQLPILELIHAPIALASIFFFILSKIMSRAVEMEKESRLYV